MDGNVTDGSTTLRANGNGFTLKGPSNYLCRYSATSNKALNLNEFSKLYINYSATGGNNSNCYVYIMLGNTTISKFKVGKGGSSGTLELNIGSISRGNVVLKIGVQSKVDINVYDIWAK